MKSNFDACLAELLRHEGGFTLNRADPGNWTGGKVGVGSLRGTNMGISAAAYPGEDIRGMTRARAATIYRRDYWDKVRGDDLPAGLDLVALDAAANSGPLRGAKWLQGAVGAVPDGKIGPATLAAARACDPVQAINRACDARLDFLRGLGTWPTFGKGWARRVESIRATALDMAQPPRPEPKPVPRPVPKPTLKPAPYAPPASGFWAWLLRLLRGRA